MYVNFPIHHRRFRQFSQIRLIKLSLFWNIKKYFFILDEFKYGLNYDVLSNSSDSNNRLITVPPSHVHIICSSNRSSCSHFRNRVRVMHPCNKHIMVSSSIPSSNPNTQPQIYTPAPHTKAFRTQTPQKIFHPSTSNFYQQLELPELDVNTTKRRQPWAIHSGKIRPH